MLKIFRNTEGSVYGAAILIGVVVFLLKFSAHVLNPYNCDWLLGGGDDTTEYISWLYYRSTPFTFPVIGTLTGYDYPTTTGVGLTGAIPLIAIPMKFLTYGQIADFQYFGWWFLSCYALQGYFSVRLMKAIAAFKNVKIAPIAYVLGASFFVLSPALLTRTGHMNLCGQWLILWGFTIYFESKTRRESVLNFLKIVGVTALVHQYLLLMIFGIGFATFWRLGLVEKQATDSFLKRAFSWIQNLFFNVLNVALAMVLWFFVGNFNVSTDTMKQAGFGKYSANLNVFFNGLGEQKLFKNLDFNDGQYEGFGYLGVGLLLLGAFSLIFRLFKPKAATNVGEILDATRMPPTTSSNYFSWFSPLGFIAILFAAYAFGNTWTWGHETVLTAQGFYEKNHSVDYLSQAFRASGRFIWVLHYFLMVQIIIAFLKSNLPNALKISLFAILTAVQIFDISAMVQREKANFDFDGYAPSVMTPKNWETITVEANRIVMLPPYSWNYNSGSDYFHFAHLTALRHQDITTGYLARPDAKAHGVYEKKVFANLERGDLEGEELSIFIAGKRYFPKLKKLVDKGQVKAFEYQGYAVAVPIKFEKTIQYLSQLPNCQSLRFETPDLTAFLKQHSTNKIILAVVRDEASERLCDDAKKQFISMGVDIVKLGFRGSFAAIIIDGKSVFSGIENGKAVFKTVKKGDILRGPVFLKNIDLQSAGGLAGNFGKILIDGKDYSLASRGFNFVVLDKQFNVLKTAYFDTYDDCAAGEVRNVEVKSEK